MAKPRKKEKRLKPKKSDIRHADGRFKPGHSIGRPKGTLSLVSMLKKKLKEIPKGEKETYAQKLINRWIAEAIEGGDLSMLKEAVRYVDGMPVQRNVNENRDMDKVLEKLESGNSIDEEINND